MFLSQKEKLTFHAEIWLGERAANPGLPSETEVLISSVQEKDGASERSDMPVDKAF